LAVHIADLDGVRLEQRLSGDLRHSLNASVVNLIIDRR
jgi:hypothetical protein